MFGRKCLLLSLITLACGLTGCHIITGLTYFFGPARIQKAEFHFGDGPVAIFIESAAAEGGNPIFERELHIKLRDIFRAKKISTNVVPFDKAMSLPRRHPDFRSWNLQKIGRGLGADQLLYVRIMELRVRESRDVPLLTPMVRLETKVIDVNAPPSRPRAWPGTGGGRELTPVTRETQEVSSREQTDRATIKLARDAAYRVAEPFYDVDLESPAPREP
jgi:hypothetical protein